MISWINYLIGPMRWRVTGHNWQWLGP